MGILSRFKDIMSANINSLLDKAENPEKMIDQCLRNLNSDLGKVKSETAAVMAEDQRSKRALDEVNAEIDKMQQFAVKALEAGNENDARKFLEKKSSLSAKQQELQQSYDLAHTNAENMRAMHDKLVKDINELESRRDMIKGKMAVAKTQERMNKMVSGLNGNSSIAAFDRMEAKANAALDKANDLTAKYSSNTAQVDDELAALKASLGQQDTTAVDDELAALKANLNK